MALLDLAGQDTGLPIWRLLGGRGGREPVSYFCYLARDTAEGLHRQCAEAVSAGYEHFYLKVGIDPAEDERMIAAVREAIGPERKISIDANEAWPVPVAVKLIARWDAAYDLDFVEAPVRARPVHVIAKLRQRLSVRSAPTRVWAARAKRSK